MATNLYAVQTWVKAVDAHANNTVYEGALKSMIASPSYSRAVEVANQEAATALKTHMDNFFSKQSYITKLETLECRIEASGITIDPALISIKGAQAQ